MRRKQVVKLVSLLITFSLVCFFYTLVMVPGTKDKEHSRLTFPHMTKLSRENSEQKNIRNETIITETGRNRSTVMSSEVNGSRNNFIKPRTNPIRNSDRYINNTKPQHSNNHSDGSIHRPLSFVPSFRQTMGSNRVPYLNSVITEKYLALPDSNYTQRVAIVSPIRNAERSLETFRAQLQKLSYSHQLLSVYFGESGSTDKTFIKAENITRELKRFDNFNDARVIDLRMAGGISGPQHVRHKIEYQRYRRSFLAVARNRLVRYTLQQQKFDYVLSIDSDILEFPSDLVQQMLFAKSDIVVTSCLVKHKEYKYMYDCNSWRETDESIKYQSYLSLDALVLECYDKRRRRHFLPQLRAEGRVVKLDGVGGCALMVKADCFRSGLQFPEVVYKRHIETEGLAKMGLDMGYSVVGLPFVEVFHQKWD